MQANEIRRQLFLLILAILTSMPASFAQSRDLLDLDLFANGERKFKHAREFPLSIEVVLSNPTATNIFLENQAQLFPSKSESAGGRKPDPQKVPVTTVGSKDRPVASRITFKAFDQNHKEVPSFSPRLLKSSVNSPAEIRLDGSNSESLYFGLLPDELEKFGAGPIEIIALVKQTLPEDASKEKEIKSTPLKLTICSANELTEGEKLQLNYLSGKFFLAEEQYSRVASYADFLEKDCPQPANVLRAQMYIGMKDFPKAKVACKKAIDLYAENTRDEPGVEPPTFLFHLMNKIGAKTTEENP